MADFYDDDYDLDDDEEYADDGDEAEEDAEDSGNDNSWSPHFPSTSFSPIFWSIIKHQRSLTITIIH